MLKRRWVPLVLALIAIMVVLAGCGTKKSKDVVGSLLKKMDQMESYMGEGTLVIQSSQNPQEYEVEVWHKKPDHYRISLTNRERNITQIILRNEEGVFVLTPHLNKSFRFQSGWPDNNGQIYLFESLARSILDDEEREFTKEDEGYLYQVKANYQNRSLVSQKIWLHEKTLAPQRVEVLNNDGQVLVELTFQKFEFNANFDDDAFDMDRNLTGYRLQSIPAAAPQEEVAKDFWPILPGYTPEGVVMKSLDEVTRDEESAYIVKYDGEYQYTIIQEAPKEKMVTWNVGEPVDLGFTIGVITQQGEVKRLSFTYDGIDFSIMTGNLPIAEMEKVAASVFGQVGK